MREKAEQALKNAVASAAMEGLTLEQRHLDTIERIWEGQGSLQEYFDSLRKDSKVPRGHSRVIFP